MNTGKETWKWALVVLLLAVFLITANQAYQHLANQEDFDAPDDYLKGDSWDLEHQTGPGAGQPIEVKNDNSNQNSAIKKPTKTNQRLVPAKTIIFDDKSKWNQSEEKKSIPEILNSNTPNAEPTKKVESETPVAEPVSKAEQETPVVEPVSKTEQETPVAEPVSKTEQETPVAEPVSKAETTSSAENSIQPQEESSDSNH